MRKIKFLIFIICLLFLFFFIISYFSGDNSFSSNIDFSSLVENDDFVIGLSSNNNIAAYDFNSKTYYISRNLFDVHDLKIMSPYKTLYNVDKIDDDLYSINIYSDRYHQQRYIKTLDLSIISIKNFNDISDYNYINRDFILSGKQYSDAYFEIMDNDYLFHNSYPKSQYYQGRFRVRGASSSWFSKKSYKIEFDDNVSLLGMSKDDDWILDSLYTDKSKVRNKLSSDLWNCINDNQQVNNDLNGDFVDLFVNNEYVGVYVLKEKVDKKITDIGESGLLVKSISHVNDEIRNRFIINSVNYNTSGKDVFLENFELKEYNTKSLNNFILKLGDYYSDYSYDSINRNFDIDNFINYKVFVMLISGGDNLTKNQYMSIKDDSSNILITPWDLDLTWGLNWFELNDLHSQFSMESSSDINWMDENITKNMDIKTISLLKQRYWELRKDVITMDNINGYLDSYKNILVNSGAAQRDSERWYQYDVEFEIEQIREWARRRIEFLDEYFK